MNPRPDRQRFIAAGSSVAAILFAAVWLGLLGFNSLAFEGSYSADSVFYIDAARNIAAGDGIVNRLARLDWAVRSGTTLPEPMTTWPPLYPAVLAAGEAVGIPAAQCALVVPVVCAGLLVIAAAAIARMGFGWSAAVLTVAVFTQFPSLRFASVHAWSETMGLALALVALPFAFAALRSDKGYAWALAAGIAAGCAFATRYALGPFIVPLMAVALWPHIDRRSLTRAVAIACGFALAAVPVLARNALLTGQIGGPEPAEGAGFLHHALAVLALLRWIFVPEGALPRLVYTAVLVIVVAYGIRYGRSRGVRNALAALCAKQRWVLWAWPLLYLFVLVLSETRYVIEPVNARLVLPATAVLLIGFAGIAARLLPKPRITIAVAAALLTAHAAWAEWDRAAPILRAGPPAAYNLEQDVAKSETMTWVRDHVNDNDLIIAVDSFDMALYLGPINMLFLFSALAPEAQPDYEAIRAYLQAGDTAYDNVYIVLRRQQRLGLPEASGYALVDDLRKGNTAPYPAIAAIGVFDDGSVYSLRVP